MVLLLSLGVLLAQTVASDPIPASTHQLLLVTPPDWSATSGRLQRYERSPEAGWVPVGDAVAVVVGRSGLGWGRGLHDASRLAGPVKAEGDGRAPAGVFRLSAAFGYAPSLPTGLPYVPVPDLQCVDDRTSASYNLVRAPGDAPDWVSHETMRRRDGLYRIGAIVAHNGPAVDPSLLPATASVDGSEPVAGAGSCIFLHVWSGPTSTTAGCTAMADPALAEVLAWLRADAGPVLVQLPAAVRRDLEVEWALPE